MLSHLPNNNNQSSTKDNEKPARQTLWSKLRVTDNETMLDPEQERKDAYDLYQRQIRTYRNRSKKSEVEIKMRPNRFKEKCSNFFSPHPMLDCPPGMTRQELELYMRETRLEEITNKLQAGELEIVTNATEGGNNVDTQTGITTTLGSSAFTNSSGFVSTKHARAKEHMQNEQSDIISYLVNNTGWFTAPLDYRPSKKIKRILIPQDRYTDYNFMGLIIGPRGLNHKRLETESGALISIRGQGTLKEGKKTDHQTEEESVLAQHVHISAEDESKLQKAVELIVPLLDPLHPLHEQHRKRGLNEIAILQNTNEPSSNAHAVSLAGTRCEVCGEQGHYAWKCPFNSEYQYER